MERIRHLGYGFHSGLVFIGEGRAGRRTVMDADHGIIGRTLTDETAADGIPDLFVDQVGGIIECLESHAVGMGGHALPLLENHVMVIIEMNTLGPGEIQGVIQRAGLANMQHMIGIHCGRYIAFESGHNGAIGTVAEPSQGQ